MSVNLNLNKNKILVDIGNRSFSTRSNPRNAYRPRIRGNSDSKKNIKNKGIKLFVRNFARVGIVSKPLIYCLPNKIKGLT